MVATQTYHVLSHYYWHKKNYNTKNGDAHFPSYSFLGVSLAERHLPPTLGGAEEVPGAEALSWQLSEDPRQLRFNHGWFLGKQTKGLA